MVDMGTIFKKALAIMGTAAVTVIWTGRVIHQKIIHSAMPTAWAPLV